MHVKFIIKHKRWLIGAFVVASIALIVWFVGPLIAIADAKPLGSVFGRVLTILLITLCWLGVEGWFIWREHRRNRAMLDALTSGSDNSSLSRADSEELSRRFRNVIKTLSGKKLGGGGTQLLYQLPWYMFIGPPGSGKTTALKNSGLRFPVLDASIGSSEIAGIGGTRNCDWLFTEDAVLIDTAGRYVTQDSNAQVDNSEWRTFLQLLRRYRPRQPINGIIVSLSVQDLLQTDDAGRIKLANQVRARVEELQNELAMQFPIYLMVTKCDLISGFSEFFAAFDAEQRSRVWGTTFAFDPVTRKAAALKTSFDAEFPLLVERLNRLLMARLSEERDTDRRAALYPFPQQFASLGPMISSWLNAAFGDTRYAQSVIVRGVYFTSGTQFGSPIDRVMAGIAQTLDLRGGSARQTVNSSNGKSYFIRDLFNAVIFREAGLAGHSEAREARRRRLAWGLAIGCASVSTALIAGWTLSYFKNQQGLVAANQVTVAAAKELQAIGAPAINDLPVLLDALDAVLKIPSAVHDPVDSPPLSMKLGLYQGDAVDARVSERYRYVLQQALLVRVALHLESVMQSPQASSEQVYASLKTYLMLFDRERMNHSWFIGVVYDLWRSAYDATAAARARVHLQALAETSDLLVARFHPKNEAIVEAARARVASTSIVDRAYAMLKLSVSTGEGIRLSEVLGPAGVSVMERKTTALSDPISATFTAEGYRKDVKPNIERFAQLLAEEESWVMGGRASGLGRGDLKAISAEIQRRYFEEYKSTWRNVLADIRLRKMEGLRSAQNVAQVLSQGDSPLKRLVEAVAEQSRLSSSADVAKNAAVDAGAAKLKDAATSATAGIFGSQSTNVVAAAIPVDSSRALERQLEDHFSDIRRLASDGKGGEIDVALGLIGEISTELVAIQQRLASGQGIREMPPSLIKASSQADRFPAPINGIIKDLVAVAGGEASGGMKKEMQSGVGGASSMCRRSIPGRYPFSRTAMADVGIQDFVGVFKAGGDLDAFFQANLVNIVDRSGSNWRLKADGAAPISASTLRQFQNADAIRTAFLGGGSTAQIIADFTVVNADSDVAFEYDGTIHKLKSGNSIRINWPARPGAKLVIGNTTVVQAEGAWALFRLVDKGQMDAAASVGDRVKLIYSTPGNVQKAVIEVRTGSAAFNPFRLRELQTFACPQE